MVRLIEKKKKTFTRFFKIDFKSSSVKSNKAFPSIRWHSKEERTSVKYFFSSNQNRTSSQDQLMTHEESFGSVFNIILVFHDFCETHENSTAPKLMCTFLLDRKMAISHPTVKTQFRNEKRDRINSAI